MTTLDARCRHLLPGILFQGIYLHLFPDDRVCIFHGLQSVSLRGTTHLFRFAERNDVPFWLIMGNNAAFFAILYFFFVDGYAI
jgi:hypothetical protein